MPPPDESTLRVRRQRVGAALRPILGEAVLLIHAGTPLPLPENTDQTYPFFSHAEFIYLAGHEIERGIVAFDPKAPDHEAWVTFVPALTESERVWEGRTQAPGTLLSLLPSWQDARAGRPVIHLGAPPAEHTLDSRAATVREHLRHARRPKDAGELRILRDAAACTAAGYARLPSLLKPGTTERSIQIELEAEFQRAGGSGTGYGTIVGAGSNAAILHVAPSDRALRHGDFVLVDAGARVGRYVCDVTRTYVVGGQPSAVQRDLHDLVASVLRNAVSRCRPGREWKEIHLLAAEEICAGLVTMGLMRGRPADLVQREAHTLFFPHGLGHLVGLGVRDASGLAPGRAADPRPALRTLRCDLPLAEHYVITVEPGIYFIRALLEDPRRRERYADCVNWNRVDPLLDLGGVRLEENVLVTTGEPDVLTAAIPMGYA
jgi:Xaa-Pro aminopeptidase